jgi:hypothetical protein
MKSLQTQHKESLKSILTAEQLQKLEAKRKDIKEGKGKRERKNIK